MTQTELFRFIERTAWDADYWRAIDLWALDLDSDGCTGVPDWFLYSCKEHDCHFRTHKTMEGKRITFEEANYCMRRRIQQGSIFGTWSPISWIRWMGVNLLGRSAWEKGFHE
jgi:hypothetical protein|tara:strand:- start:2938 stop:3273 length:336 start_codon:yes stop_codon:yes gene_type:complete